MNYPTGTKRKNLTDKNHSNINYRNRGMTLEAEINLSNEYYQEIDKAYIYKKPTPIKITKVDYPSRDKAVIKEAFFTVPSTTDYNGIYKGKYIDFEAKETRSSTSFNLNNIHPHQIKHLSNVYNHGGIAFVIVRFTILNETYLLKAEDLLSYIANSKRKSIPLAYFKEKAYILSDNYRPRIDYLQVVDLLIGGN